MKSFKQLIEYHIELDLDSPGGGRGRKNKSGWDYDGYSPAKKTRGRKNPDAAIAKAFQRSLKGPTAAQQRKIDADNERYAKQKHDNRVGNEFVAGMESKLSVIFHNYDKIVTAEYGELLTLVSNFSKTNAFSKILEKEYKELLKLFQDPNEYCKKIFSKKYKENDVITVLNDYNYDFSDSKSAVKQAINTMLHRYGYMGKYTIESVSGGWNFTLKGNNKYSTQKLVDMVNSNIITKSSDIIKHFYDVKLSEIISKYGNKQDNMKSSAEEIQTSYIEDIKIINGKQNTIFMAKLKGVINGNSDTDSIVKSLKSDASKKLSDLKSSSIKKGLYGVAGAAVAAAGVAVGGSIGLPVAAAGALYALYNYAVVKKNRKTSNQIKTDYEIHESTANMHDLIKNLKVVYSELQSLDINNRKYIESILITVNKDDLKLISNSSIKHVSDIAKKLLQTKLKEETMLEKIRRIKASMMKESSDALCSLCQVAPCDCAKGNHIDESAEQLDELSKETLGSYKHKAELSIPKDDREYANRSKGINRAEKKMKKEELSGNQHKLDKNKNGKVDKHDFKLLRKEAAHPFDEFTAEELEQFMQTEDYQQLDELSKKTLGSYVKKAKDNMGLHAVDHGKYGDQQKDKHSLNKAIKRSTGIDKAVDRLTKEANEYPTKATNVTTKDSLEPKPAAEKAFKDKHQVKAFNRPDKDKNQDGADKITQAKAPGIVGAPAEKLKSLKSFIKQSDE